MRFALLALSLGLLGGCQTRPLLHVETGRIVPWSKELGKLGPYPLVARYTQGAKRLVYVGSPHDTRPDSPAFRAIAQVLGEEPKFDLLIVEGFPSGWGTNPAQVVKWAQEPAGKNSFQAGEHFHAVRLALQRGISFQGGEPAYGYENDVLKKYGHTKADILNFYFLRQVPQDQRAGALRGLHDEQVYKKVTQGMFGARAEVPSFAEFQAWYQKAHGKPYATAQIGNETTAPYVVGTLPQRMAAQTTTDREGHILARITEALNSVDSVVVVYGGSHYPMQKPALDAMLGPPLEVKVGVGIQ